MSKASSEPSRHGFATRRRGKLLALFVATLVALYLCYRLVEPFLPAVVGATAAAIVTRRLSRWVGQRVRSPSVKAGICVAIVATVVLAPAAWVGYVCVQELTATVQNWQSPEGQKRWEQWLAERPKVQRMWAAVSKDDNLVKEAPRLIEQLQPKAFAAAAAPVYVLGQMALTLFLLFYLYRDDSRALTGARALMPLSTAESNKLFRRVADTVHATIYGTVAVAAVQGALGGIMFWLLGLPGAVLWGAVMGLLSIIPYLGAFVVWGPAAAALYFQGEWGKAIALAGWGTLAVGLIDNLLYPMLVGKRLRQHTVMAFLAIIGGIAVFGAIGVVLGPVTVAITQFLLEVWRERTAHGAADDATT